MTVDVVVEGQDDGDSVDGGLEVEVQGQADFVYRMPDGSWHVVDLKVALAEVTPDTWRRYQLQVTTYAWLLEAEDGVNEPVIRVVQTVGAVTDRTVLQWPRSIVARRLWDLLDEASDRE
jgi:ATP-dependent helicase/nuclease subunit A